MKKTLFSFFLVFAAFAILTGMGATPPGSDPAKLGFKGTVNVLDDQGISTKCSGALWDGEAQFKGIRGSGTVTIPFEKVRRVLYVGSAGNRKVDFQIILRTGETIAVTFDDDVRLSGTTPYGTYRIPAKNIKELSFE